ncbi:MAG: putative peptidoglycan glycosyltransferase FtsW [Pseudomonadota bacterium]
MTEMAFRGAPPRRADTSLLEDWWRSVDRWSLGAMLVLCAAGIVLGLAASPPLALKNDLHTYHYVLRQVVFTGVAVGAMVAVSMLPLQLIRRAGLIGFALFLVLTAALPWLGTDFGKGAVRWYSLGFASLQPSEFLKPAFVIVTAWLMAGATQAGGPPGRLISGMMACTIAGLLALQPDFGQASLVMAVWTAMLFASGAPVAFLMVMGGLVAVAGTLAYINSSHFAGRIDGYLAGSVDPTSQLGYAQAAIREGGLFGVGAAQGSVKSTLPDAHTDFVIAVAAEEFGLLITLVVIGLYLLITLRSMARVFEVRDPFLRLGGTGLAVLFGLQAFINFGVAIRLLPAKGMTLPFISYGGSSALAAGLAAGALLALTRTRRLDMASDLRSRV